MEKYYEALKEVNNNQEAIEQMLEEIAQEFLEENFDMDLEIPIKLNGRLKRAMGRFKHIAYFKESVMIDISKYLVVESIVDNSKDKLVDVLKHELVHYALYEKDLPCNDNDYMFINTCNKLDVGLSGTMKLKSRKHIYECENGHKSYINNKIDVRRYICGCGKHLEYKGEIYK